MSRLSERIAKANTEGLNSRGVERRAAELGLKISHGTAANIMRGKHGIPEDRILRALSGVFKIPFGELRQLVGLEATDEPWQPPSAASRLSPKQRRLVESLIHELARPVEEPKQRKDVVVGTATTVSRKRPSRRS